ncbi:MAG: glycosyltransferase, partial [Patescibacteria group bacterium]
MRVFYFTDFFFPNMSGIATAIGNLSAGLAKRGHKITIFAPKVPNNSYRAQHSDIDLQYISSIPSGIPDAYISFPPFGRLSKYFKQFPPDIVHVQSEFIVGMVGILMAKLKKKPLVGNFHGYLSFGNLGIPKMEFIETFFFKYVVFSLNRCDAVVSPAKLGIHDLQKYGLKRPIHFIPNCVDEDEFKTVDSEKVELLKQKYGLRKNVVLYIGRMAKEKSIDVLLQSFAL